MAAVLPAFTGALAAVYAVLVAAHQLLLPDESRAVLTGAAGVSALALAAVGAQSRRVATPPALAHPATFAAILLVATNSGLALALTGEERQTTGFLLALVLAGATLVARRWFVACTVAVWAVWSSCAVTVVAVDGWAHSALAMLAATGAATLVNTERRRSLQTLAELQEAADAEAVRDALTGVVNRRGLEMLVAPMLEGARRRGDAVHCHFLDVDRLHEVSGVLGIAATNEVLVAVAEALVGSTRGTDAIARWNPQEFVVVGPGPGMPSAELERRVRDRLAADPPVDPRTWSARVTAGGAVLTPWDSGSLESLLDSAADEMRRRRSVRQVARPSQPAGGYGVASQ